MENSTSAKKIEKNADDNSRFVEMFLPDANSCGIIFPQENTLRYEWNDNFPSQFSVKKISDPVL